MIPDEFAGPNVRAPRYFVARTLTACVKCGQWTEVSALALPAEHETLDPEADADMGAWSVAGCTALIFHVEWLAENLQYRLRQCSPSFCADPSCDWVNHCLRCGFALDDYPLHCEPHGAFVPMSHAEARAIELIPIDAPFEARAAGYSCGPPFFRFAPGA